ncbi:MAG TPA: methyltransferase domain-containing protein [Motilibacteraceae bacterium]|nr:methyltransferase domain-containing protein [Motilibacteraceae bacterium]
MSGGEAGGAAAMASAARWDGRLYAENTAHHRTNDANILADLRPPADGTVLDVGCGVGDLTERLTELVPQGRVLGVDADPSMVEQAAHRARPGLAFAVAPVQDLGAVADDASVDLVVSTACLHWVPAADQPVAVAELARVLRPGGTLRVDMGGAGQIAATRELLDAVSESLGGPASPWFFPTPEEYGELLARAGFDVGTARVRLLRQRRPVPDESAVLGWLRSQVLIAYTARMDADVATAFTAEVERRAVEELRREDGSYDQDYVRLDVLATRSG